MGKYLVQRFIAALPTLFLITVLGFVIMELPEGDYLTHYIAELQQMGHTGAKEEAEILRKRYALDRPAPVRFVSWLTRFVQGDFGDSFEYMKPVRELIGERLAITVILSLVSLIITWGIGIPIGVYSATHQYRLGDHFFTFMAFLGLGMPDFLLALILLVAGSKMFGVVPTGLFSPQFEVAPWSWARVVDLMKHLWIPASIVAVSGTASLIRMMRANLLDVLRADYVQVCRSKGLREAVVVWKHAVRNAVHPLVMSLGMSLPTILSGSAIIGIVLHLPNVGPLYLQAMRQQDVYLGGTILILMSLMLVIGNLLADLTLALLDPRIRLD